MAAQRLSLACPLHRLSEVQRSLDDFVASQPPPAPPSAAAVGLPGAETLTGLVVSACYACGSVSSCLRPSAQIPKCYWCGGLWFLGLTAAPATPAPPAPLAPPIPSFLSHLSPFPPPVVVAAANRLRLWIADVVILVEELGPSVVVSPPFGAHHDWMYFFDVPDPASRRSSARAVDSAKTLEYSRLQPTGYWAAVAADFQAALFVEADHCRGCGRPHLAQASVSLPSGELPTGGPRVPALFCTHQIGAPPQLTRQQAARSFGSHQGVPLHGAVPTSALQWSSPCVPSEDRPALDAPPWVTSLPSPWPSHPPPSPQTARALSHNIGGARSKQTELLNLLQALSPHVVALQETWQQESAVSQFPDGYIHVRGTPTGPGTGHLISLPWDVVSPDSPPEVRHDGREWRADTRLTPLLGSCFVASVHLAPCSPWAQKGRSIRAMATLAASFRPAVALLMGDFNCAADPGTPWVRP